MTEPGSRLSHYEVVAALGKGGMGEVWRARDTKLGREVAIKTLPEEFARDSERVARFEREAKLLASLNHPNIAAIHGLEEAEVGAERVRFLVLELVEGDTLGDRLKRGAIPVEEALKLALQIADALRAAHDSGVIHRDLKPDNIKVSPDGKVKVLDFGLAKAFSGDESEANVSNSPTLSMQATQQGVILGTAAYMSPEQAKGRAADKRADIWAFGCVLYEMLTGRQVFAAEDVSTILARVLDRDPDYTILEPRLHPRLRDLLERCLQKRPEHRYHDIADVRLDIENVLDDPSGVIVEPAGSARARTSSVLGWTLAFVLGAVIAGLGAWALMPSPTPPLARLTANHPGGGAIGNDFDADVILSPDGTRILYLAGSSAGAAGQLYVRDLDDFEPRLLAESARTPFFSPDGAWAGFTQANALKKTPVTGGPPLTLTEVGAAPRGATWGPDNTIVFAANDGATGLMRVSADGGDAEVLTTVDPERGEVEHLWPEFLPDGHAVLFAIITNPVEESRIAVLDLETLEYEILLQGGSNPRYSPTGHIVYAIEGTLRAIAFDPDSRQVNGSQIPIFEGVITKATGAGSFHVSPSGSLVYRAGAATTGLERTLAWVDRMGNVVTLDLPPNAYVDPSLSPDGTRVAVETQGEEGSAIWIYDLSGDTALQRLTLEGNNFLPIWTPDGERITFASDRDGTTSIYWQRADGSGVAERLTTAEEGTYHWPASWSPDGTTLAFTLEHAESGLTGSTTNEMDIWAISLDRPDELAVLSAMPHPEQEIWPQFSPDGDRIAFVSGDAEALEWNIYVQPYPPTGERRQVSVDGGGGPFWSADGTELFYRPLDSGLGLPSLRGVRVSMEPAFSFSDYQEWAIDGFPYLGYTGLYDVSSDGQQFLVALPADQTGTAAASRSQINVVLNWAEELKALVPVP